MVTSTRPAPKACAITCCVTWAKFLSAARLVPRWVTHLVSSSALFSVCFSCLPSTLRLSTSLQSNFSCHATREVPKIFQRLNKWGVPSAGMLLATLVPMLLVIVVKDMSGLADLYAVGVVGAIATNLGATSTDRKLSIKSWERTLMFATFIVMAAIELSLLIDKPNARYFAVTILAVGLILRGLVQERRMKKEAAPTLAPPQLGVDVARPMSKASAPSGGEAILCA